MQNYLNKNLYTMNNVRDKIYDKCLNTVDNEFADEIDDLIENIIEEQRNNNILQIQELKNEHENKCDFDES